MKVDVYGTGEKLQLWLEAQSFMEDTRRHGPFDFCTDGTKQAKELP